MKEKLKIGILLNDYSIPSWEYQILRDIESSDYAEIVLVIKNSPVSSTGGAQINIAHFITNLVEKADRAIFKTRSDYKMKKDTAGFFQDILKLEINTVNEVSSGILNDREIIAIKDINPDIFIKFGSQILHPEIVRLPKYGVWIYSIEKYKENNLPETGFWEVIRKVPVTNSRLGIFAAGKEGLDIISDSWESTCQYSININRNSLSWRSALFAPRIMNGLYKYGGDYLEKLKNRFYLSAAGGDISVSPASVSDAVGSLFRYPLIVLKRIIKKLYFTDAFNWDLLFKINDGAELYSSQYGSFKKLSSPRGIFWADPFVIAEDDRYCIFVEEFIYKKDRAHISVLKLDRKGNFLSSQKIIERPYHMSYPFIFKNDNTYYMIPETCKNRTIELYKCTEFPDKWEFDRNIMENISAVDTTLFFHNNKWWLFTAVDQTANISGCSAELFLFFADDIFSGKWESHPLNPIVTDIRRARPAGKLFIQDGKICRPSQNCAGRYGIGFNINHITRLTENEYEESLISEVKPLWDGKLRGTHTLNFDRDFTIIDVYSFRKRIPI